MTTLDAEASRALEQVHVLANWLSTAKANKNEETYGLLLPRYEQAGAEYRSLLYQLLDVGCVCGHQRRRHLNATTRRTRCTVCPVGDCWVFTPGAAPE